MLSNPTEINKEETKPPSALPVPFKTKKQFSKKDFEFISKTGEGSYAKVYKVKDLTSPNQPFKAIKVMEIRIMKQQHKLYQVYLENEVLHSLFHPNLVNIEGIFEEKNKIFIVLEYLSKGDFSELITLNYPLKDDTIKFYAAEIVNALGYLMANKIVHRDLKPENIMLDDKFHLKFIDFATARILGKVFNQNTMTFEDEIKEEKKEEKKTEEGEKKEGEEGEEKK
ncbi:MAG: protein kinase, partial [archaeon]|nr:protein kinase [archaeon]